MKGLLVTILSDRVDYDCTLHGISSKNADVSDGRGKQGPIERMVLSGAGIAQIFEPSVRSPEIEITITQEGSEVRRSFKKGYALVLRNTPSGDLELVRGYAHPVGKPHGMFGGNFITSSDSRFPFEGPVPLFDRFE